MEARQLLLKLEKENDIIIGNDIMERPNRSPLVPKTNIDEKIGLVHILLFRTQGGGTWRNYTVLQWITSLVYRSTKNLLLV